MGKGIIHEMPNDRLSRKCLMVWAMLDRGYLGWVMTLQQTSVAVYFCEKISYVNINIILSDNLLVGAFQGDIPKYQLSENINWKSYSKQ